MADKKRTTLADIIADTSLTAHLDKMIDSGKTLENMQDFLKSMDYPISLNTIRKYKSRRAEAVEKGVPLEDLADKRNPGKSGNILELAQKEDKSFERRTPDITDFDDTTPTDILSDLDFLESTIQKASETLRDSPVVDPKLGMDAIKLKYQITGGSNQGLTLSGIKAVKLQQKAYEKAISAVIWEYIPKDKHEAVMERMADVEQDYYDKLNLSTEGRKVSQAMKQAGI